MNCQILYSDPIQINSLLTPQMHRSEFVNGCPVTRSRLDTSFAPQMRELLGITEEEARNAALWYPSILAVRPERLAAVVSALQAALQLDRPSATLLLARNPQTFGVPPGQVGWRKGLLLRHGRASCFLAFVSLPKLLIVTSLDLFSC